jgi:hypothetical protein
MLGLCKWTCAHPDIESRTMLLNGIIIFLDNFEYSAEISFGVRDSVKDLVNSIIDSSSESVTEQPSQAKENLSPVTAAPNVTRPLQPPVRVNQSHTLSSEELFSKVQQFVVVSLFEDGYKILSRAENSETIPNIAAMKDGTTYYIQIESSVHPTWAMPTRQIMRRVAEEASKVGAQARAARVSVFNKNSQTPEEMSILSSNKLGFNYKGLEV